MKLFLVFLLLAHLAFSQSTFFTGGNICKDEDWHLTFSDEFDGDSLDQSKWSSHFPCSDGSDQCDGARVADGGIYLDSNIIVSNGTLKFITKKQTTTWFSKTRDYTSGMIYSKSSPYRFKYGKFEIRCKVPSGKGFFSTFWMFGGDGVGTATEIDVFEISGSTPNHHHLGILKYHETELISQYDYGYDGNDFSREFHVFDATWDPFFINFSVDGTQVFHIARFMTLAGREVNWCCVDPGVYNMNPSYPSGESNQVSIIAFLTLLTGNDAPNNSTTFPNQMEVDYIRLYQRDTISKPDNECVITLFPNPVLDKLTVKKNNMNFIKIQNVFGEEILSLKVNGDESEIDVSDLKRGIYFILVNSGTDILSGKLIKL
ncbi:MAG: family 16 glycosylhydrolase [Bacteroidota bacterium]